MISDPELDQWSELFRSEQVEPAEIVTRAQQAIRRFHLWIYAEVAVTIIVGGGALCWSIRAHQRAFTALTVVAIAAPWLFRLTNDWNDFSGATTTTDSYLNILLRRLRSNLRSADFSAVLFFVLLGLMSAWGFREWNRESPLTLGEYLALPANIAVAIGTSVFYVWLILYRRKLQKEIHQLEQLQKEFAEEPAAPRAAAMPELLARAINDFQRRLKNRLRVW